MKTKMLGAAALMLCASFAVQAAELDVGKAKELASKSGCFSCHDMKNKVVGPSYHDIAQKYKDEKGMVDVLAQKITGGSKGAWGRIAMPANNVSREEAKLLAAWVLATK